MYNFHMGFEEAIEQLLLLTGRDTSENLMTETLQVRPMDLFRLSSFQTLFDSTVDDRLVNKTL